MIEKERIKGPYIFENWRAFSDGKAIKGMIEFPIFSDVDRIVGEEKNKYRPYIFINPVPTDTMAGDFCPVLYVRIEDYLVSTIPDFDRTQTEAYHGGLIFDEIAALISLALGIRTQAGKITREFYDSREPQGRPVGWRRQPRFLSIDHSYLVIPSAVVGKKTLDEISLFAKIPNLEQDEANALIKSARSYQKALLVSEDDPSLSWLFFVTAVEKAASFWMETRSNAVTIMEEWEPGFLDELKKICVDAVELVSHKFAGIYKSANKFVQFIKAHKPDPPPIRPPEWAKINWDKGEFEEALKVIYKHRSNALHEGTPFPIRICECPPRVKNENGEVCWHEKPIGMGASALGGTWLEKDLPMYLNSFEYIVRNCLLKWWRGLAIRH